MLIAPLALALLASTHVDVSVGVGVGSNPFELPSPAPSASASPSPTPVFASPQPASFVPLRVLADARRSLGHDVTAAVRAELDAELYTWVHEDPAILRQPPANGASHGSGYLAAPVTWRAWAQGTRSLDLAFEPFVGVHRETFTSPLTGRAYSAGGVSYGRRFDTNRAGGRASADFAASDALDSWVSIGFQRVDYVNDFRGIPTIDSWDYDELRLDADTWLYPSFGVVSASYGYRHRMYDERFPHDTQGTPVQPGTPGYAPQVFDLHDVTLRGGYDGERGRALLRADLERRIDVTAGYLDSTELSIGAELRTTVPRDWTVSLEPSWSTRVYDVAHVNYDPAAPAYRRVRVDLTARGEHPLSARTSVWVEAGYEDQHSANALYTYRGIHGATGVRFQFR